MAIETITFNTNSDKIWDYLIKSGYTKNGTSGLMGNLYAESHGFKPNLVQNYDTKPNFCEQYTNNVNNGTYSRYQFAHDSKGYGIAQWTYSTRKEGLYDFTVTNSPKYSVGDINRQISYLVKELNSLSEFKDLNALLKNSNAKLKECSDMVLDVFEKPQTRVGNSSYDTRYEYSNQCYEYYKNKTINDEIEVSAINYINNLIAVAERELSYWKDGTVVNQTKYNIWWNGLPANERNYYTISHSDAWCMNFVQYCLAQAGITKVYKTLSCTDFLNNCRNANPNCIINRNKLKPGDIILFSNDNYKATQQDHVGIVISANYTDGYYETIEGNTGEKINGQRRVKRQTRRLSVTNGGPNKNLCITCGVRLFSSNSDGGNDYLISNSELNSMITVSIDNNGSSYYQTGGPISQTQATFNYKEVDVQIQRDLIKTVNEDFTKRRTKSTSLLTTPNFVESPFIILKVGKYSFGSYTKRKPLYSDKIQITYSNYLTSINVVKVNGVVNQYTIQMIYQIQAGQDPNMIDKIFSTVGYGTVYISYGDCNSPEFIYKTEEAIITNLTSSVDFANSRITYTLKCASNPVVLKGGFYPFKKQTIQPSKQIYNMLYGEGNPYGLLKMFPGMRNETLVINKGLLKFDDQPVEVEAKNGIDALSYINYLVSCMTDVADTSTGLRKSNYYLTICDDITGEFGGTYFKISKVSADENTIALDSSGLFEIDIGYPGDTMVTDFRITTNNAWNLLYNYSEDVLPETYMYNIDNNGNLVTDKSPPVMLSSRYGRVTETQRNWWTQMTQFPITAQLTVKGLVRPALLMTKLKINALFYGQRHSSSGIYVITRQEDRVDANGYRTVLSLTRIAGDMDIIQSKTETVKARILDSITFTTTKAPIQMSQDELDNLRLKDAYTALDPEGAAERAYVEAQQKKAAQNGQIFASLDVI